MDVPRRVPIEQSSAHLCKSLHLLELLSRLFTQLTELVLTLVHGILIERALIFRIWALLASPEWAGDSAFVVLLDLL
jgi:hypothetical protein